MELRKISIRGISDNEYSEIAEYFPETALKIKNYRLDDKKRTLAGRILLRKMIKKRYGIEDFTLSFNENGKPTLDFCFFSISHSGDIAVCAVSDYPVGADVQYMSGFKKRDRYMLFTASESDYVNECDCEQRFYTLWTMKEAYIKAIGGKTADMTNTKLVTPELRVNKNFGDFIFKTEKQGNYILTVCEKSPAH